MDKIINHAVLSLDFWQDTVTYEGCAMPTGTIGCEVLNISAEAIETLTPPCGSETWTTSPSSCTTMKPGSMAVFAVS